MSHSSLDPRIAWAAYQFAENHKSELSPDCVEVVERVLSEYEHVEAVLPCAYELKGNSLLFAKNNSDPSSMRKLLWVTPKKWIVTRQSGDIEQVIESPEWMSSQNPKTGGWRGFSLKRSMGNVVVAVANKRESKIPDEGAADQILKLPTYPEALSMPRLEEGAGETAKYDRVRVGDWKTAEQAAELHLKSLGFGNVQRTPAGRDGGVDVISDECSAQVKMTALPVGSPVVQQIEGAGADRQWRAVYSTSGYSDDALTFARQAGTAFFELRPDGSVKPVNEGAHFLERTQGDSVDALQWREAYAYSSQIPKRVMSLSQAVSERTDELGSGADKYPTIRALNYMRESLERLRGTPKDATPRSLCIHYHHTELLALAAANLLGASVEGGADSNERRPRKKTMEDFYS